MGNGNTGGKSIVMHSDGALYVSTHNVGRDLTITTDGKIGVGIDAPTAQLHSTAAYNVTGAIIGGGASGYNNTLELQNAGGTRLMTVMGDGRILFDTSTAFTTVSYRRFQIGQADGGWINLARTGTPADGNHLGAIQGFAKGADGNYHDTVAIDYKADGTPSNTSKPSKIEFWTTPSSSTSKALRMTIHESGNISMGGYLTAKPSPGNGDNRLAKGRHYTWNQSNLSPSIGGSSSGWYPIMDVSDGQYMFLIGTNAHNSATCIVCNGYDPSAVSRINILNSVRNNNGNYLNINQIRVLNNGVVEVYLYAGNPQYFGMYIQMITNDSVPNFYATLTKNTGSPNVDDTKDFNTYSGSVGAGLMHVENLRVDNTISKGTDNFTIEHPLESKKDTHLLNHSMIEGPQCDNIYRGKVTLSSGAATVNLDTVSNMSEGTFVVLNRDVQCFTTNETGWGAVKGSVSGNILTISAQDDSSTDTISWLVVGERQDDVVKRSNSTDSDGHLIVEQEIDINVGIVTDSTSPYGQT